MPHGRPRRNRLKTRSLEEVVEEAAAVALKKRYPKDAVERAKELSKQFKDVMCNRRVAFYSMLYMVLRYNVVNIPSNLTGVAVRARYTLYRMQKDLGVSGSSIRKYIRMYRDIRVKRGD